MKLEINGKLVEVSAPPDTPLLWFIREEAANQPIVLGW